MAQKIYFILLFLISFSAMSVNNNRIVKIQTSDDKIFEISINIANNSKTLKHIIKDLKKQDSNPIPLENISGPLFEKVVLAMNQLDDLQKEKIKSENLQKNRFKFGVLSSHLDLLRDAGSSENKEENHRKKLENILLNLNSDKTPLNNSELIDFTAAINFLDIKGLKKISQDALSQRILNKEEWKKLENLGDVIKKIWKNHAALKLVSEGFSIKNINKNAKDNKLKVISNGKYLMYYPKSAYKYDAISLKEMVNLFGNEISLKHSVIKKVLESSDKKCLISLSKEKMNKELVVWPFEVYVSVKPSDWETQRTIKVWDIENSIHPKALVTLEHLGVDDIKESLDGEYLISKSQYEGTIKMWLMLALSAGFVDFSIELNHEKVSGIEESEKFIISWSKNGEIKIWNKSKLFDYQHSNLEPITFYCLGVNNVTQSLGGDYLICKLDDGSIKIWNINNLKDVFLSVGKVNSNFFYDFKRKLFIAECDSYILVIKILEDNQIDQDFIMLDHLNLGKVVESFDGNFLFSIGGGEIKRWNKDDFNKEPVVFNHPDCSEIYEIDRGAYIVSKSLSCKPYLKLWDMQSFKEVLLTSDFKNFEIVLGDDAAFKASNKLFNIALLNPSYRQMMLILALYFLKNDETKTFSFEENELQEIKKLYKSLSIFGRTSLEQQIPDLVTKLKNL